MLGNLTAPITDWAAAWNGVELEQPRSTNPSSKPTTYQHYRPLRDSIGSFVREAQGERIYLGLEPFDTEMRGVSAGHFCLIVGRTHGGKTLTLLHIMRYNRRKRMILYTPDETSTLVLAKLAAMAHGVPSIELEQRIANGDKAAIELLHDTVDEFPNLAIFDRRLGAREMEVAYNEASNAWTAEPELMMVDFVRLVEGETMEGKFEMLKGFGMEHEVPLFALHQMSRSAGANGQEVTLEGGEFGGEQYATFQVGVRRRKFQLEAEKRDLLTKVNGRNGDLARERLRYIDEDIRYHQNTVTLNLTKNKRPGGDSIEDTDFGLDRSTGRIIELHGGLAGGYQPRKLEAVPTPRWSQSEFDGEF